MSTFVHKLTLLNRLLDATRECQTQYSTKKEIMTERNSCVSCVSRQFEDVLSHGIKQKPIISGIATIQNVTGLQLVDHDVVFWHIVQKHLSKHEVERFTNLYHVTSDIGRGRAWLRSSLNEHSLERMFQMLLSDTDGLKSFYSPDAFLLDEEKASLLPQVAAGLKSVMFSIKIDEPALNSFTQSSGNNLTHKRSDSGGTGFTLPSLTQVGSFLGHEVAMEEFPEAAIEPVGSLPRKLDQGHKKRKKKAKTKIIMFGQNGSYSERPSSVSSTDDPSTRQSRSSSRSIPIPARKESDPSSISIPIPARKEIDPFSCRAASDQDQNPGTIAREFATSPAKYTKDSIQNPPSENDQNSVSKASVSKDSLKPQFIDPIDDIYKTSVENDDEADNSGLPSSSNLQYKEKLPSSLVFHVENTNTNNLNPASLSESYSDIKIADKLESSLQLKFGSGSDLSSLNETADVDTKSIVSSSSSNQLETNHNMNSDTGSILSGNLFTPLNDTDSIASSGSFPNAMQYGIASLTLDSDSPKIGSARSLLVESKEANGKSGDLQKALVVLLQRKDELVEENKVLKELVEAEKQHSTSLRGENEQLKSQVDYMEHAMKVDAKKQLRENDVLRNQLKKYVGAVHALQYGKVPGVSQEGIPGMDEEAEAPPTNQEHTGEVKVYEQKLIEVTEMHGELMEFTESLHTRFLSALALIHKMHDELIALRGPMPTDNVIRAIEADQPRGNMSSLPTLTRALVNVWVPSAFMQGSGPESHHVYQVYICVGEDEWNVYRRYSDFFSLHNTLCRTYPEIQNFGFPPKKGIGNRNSKFVEERRKAFQRYLRLVMHNIFQNNPQLKACPTKETLIHILPFFSDLGDQCRVIVGKHKK